MLMYLMTKYKIVFTFDSIIGTTIDIFEFVTFIKFPSLSKTLTDTTVELGLQSIFNFIIIYTAEFAQVVPIRWTNAAPGIRLTGTEIDGGLT